MSVAVRGIAVVLLAACARPSPRPAAGDLVDLAAIDPTIRVDLRYATTRNFTGVAVYPVARWKIGPMNGVFALRAYQPFPCRIYPPAAAP